MCSRHLKYNLQSKSSRTRDIPTLAGSSPVSEKGMWEDITPTLMSLTHSKQAIVKGSDHTGTQTVQYVGFECLLLWSVDAVLDQALCGPAGLTWTATYPGPRPHNNRSDLAQFKPATTVVH